MNREDFEFIRSIVKERIGHAPAEDKSFQVESQLLTVARRHDLDGPEELVRYLQARPEDDLIREVTELITAKETYFFRDIMPFDAFRDVVLPAVLAARAESGRLRIWSAGCGTGEEPYSIAMILREQAELLTGWACDIEATDVSAAALEKAKSGLYSQFEVQRGVPVEMLLKYFQRFSEAWQVESALRADITFCQHDLKTDDPPDGKFDVIFCRNVLIYFDETENAEILTRIRSALVDDGYLFLGATETALAATTGFIPVGARSGLYRLAPS